MPRNSEVSKENWLLTYSEDSSNGIKSVGLVAETKIACDIIKISFYKHHTGRLIITCDMKDENLCLNFYKEIKSNIRFEDIPIELIGFGSFQLCTNQNVHVSDLFTQLETNFEHTSVFQDFFTFLETDSFSDYNPEQDEELHSICPCMLGMVVPLATKVGFFKERATPELGTIKFDPLGTTYAEDDLNLMGMSLD